MTRWRQGYSTTDMIAITGVVVAALTVALSMATRWNGVVATPPMRVGWGMLGGLALTIALFWLVMLVRWGITEFKGEDTLLWGGFIAFILGPPAMAAVLGLGQAFT